MHNLILFIYFNGIFIRKNKTRKELAPDTYVEEAKHKRDLVDHNERYI